MCALLQAEWKPTELAASAAIEEAVQVWPDGSELVPAVLLTKEEVPLDLCLSKRC